MRVPQNISKDELIKSMDRWINEGAEVFVKWTCPACGERVMCDTPNTFYTDGFLHSEKEDGSVCGCLYYGENGFGFLLSFAPGNATPGTKTKRRREL